MFTNHNPNGDSLYGSDISTHAKFRHVGTGSIFSNCGTILKEEILDAISEMAHVILA